jgi:hypothetical protein
MTYAEIESEYRARIIEIMSQTDISFLIGAGCSLCAGLPHMAQLTKMVETELNKELKDTAENCSALKLYNSICGVYSASNCVTIEDFLSEIQDIIAIVQRQKSKGISLPSVQY